MCCHVFRHCMGTASLLCCSLLCLLLAQCLSFHARSSGMLRAIQRTSIVKRITGASSLRMTSSSTPTAQRLSATKLTLDATTIANHLELTVAHLRARRCDESLINDVSAIPALRTRRNALIAEGDAARSRRKTLSKEIGVFMRSKNEEAAQKAKAEVEECHAIAANADVEKDAIDEKMKEIIARVPNFLDDRVPDGNDDTHNRVVLEWGTESRKVGEGFLWHDDIARQLGGVDPEAAVRLSGSRFNVLVGDVARLERALANYFMDFHVSRGYKEVAVPYIVSRSTMQGTGQLPKFEEDMFKVNHLASGEDAFLIPTAEVPVTNLFRDSILNLAHLPISLVCHSPSFRAEVGSHGKDTRGLLRQHQFHKVELVKICLPEQSDAEHQKLTNDAEELLRELELPYRKVLLCSGDIGFSARICYDLEVWLPGQQEYREISSCSNCYDFQSRRMMLRAKGKEDGTVYPHTINGSGVAVGRALVAVLENYQQPDGSVRIPKVLQPYFGGRESLQPLQREKDFLYR